MGVKKDREKCHSATEQSRTVVVGPVRQGRGEMLARLHYSVCQTLDGDPSVNLPLMAVAAVLRRLNTKGEIRFRVELMTLGYLQMTFSNPGTSGRIAVTTLFD